MCEGEFQSACLTMENRIKRQRVDGECVKPVNNGEFNRWDVEDTVAYLRREGMQEWAQMFRGNQSINNTDQELIHNTNQALIMLDFTLTLFLALLDCGVMC